MQIMDQTRRSGRWADPVSGRPNTHSGGTLARKTQKGTGEVNLASILSFVAERASWATLFSESSRRRTIGLPTEWRFPWQVDC